MLGVIGHRGDHRHRGCAAADHDDALARVVDVVAPELGVNDVALEAVDPGEVREVALVVAVVAAAHEQEAGGERDGLAGVGALCGDRPAGVVGRPLRADDAVVEADPAIDPVGTRRLADVVQDRLSVADCPGTAPRAEVVAEREHVGVRPHAREPEQVPGAATRVPRLEDRVALAGQVGLQVVARADAGQAGADDQHVDVLCCGRDRVSHGCRSPSNA